MGENTIFEDEYVYLVKPSIDSHKEMYLLEVVKDYPQNTYKLFGSDWKKLVVIDWGYKKLAHKDEMLEKYPEYFL
jgi:hypothetical protein